MDGIDGIWEPDGDGMLGMLGVLGMPDGDGMPGILGMLG